MAGLEIQYFNKTKGSASNNFDVILPCTVRSHK